MFEKRRLHRLFRSNGRSLTVALDHGLGLNVAPALDDSRGVVDEIVSGGADAVLATPGLIKHCSDQLGSVGVVLRVDGGSTIVEGGQSTHRLLCHVEDALRLGADAVACMGFVGSEWESQTLENLSLLAGECRNWNVPLMAEMVPGGFVQPEKHTVENIRLAVRTGIELGADFVKTPFVGTAESFRAVTQHAYRPVLVLGGRKNDNEMEIFTMVREALDAGAQGVVMGRNVWAHSRPYSMVRALSEIIHGDQTAQRAMEVLAAERMKAPAHGRIQSVANRAG